MPFEAPPPRVIDSCVDDASGLADGSRAVSDEEFRKESSPRGYLGYCHVCEKHIEFFMFV